MKCWTAILLGCVALIGGCRELASGSSRGAFESKTLSGACTKSERRALLLGGFIEHEGYQGIGPSPQRRHALAVIEQLARSHVHLVINDLGPKGPRADELKAVMGELSAAYGNVELRLQTPAGDLGSFTQTDVYVVAPPPEWMGCMGDTCLADDLRGILGELSVAYLVTEDSKFWQRSVGGRGGWSSPLAQMESQLAAAGFQSFPLELPADSPRRSHPSTMSLGPLAPPLRLQIPELPGLLELNSYYFPTHQDTYARCIAKGKEEHAMKRCQNSRRLPVPDDEAS